jgi:hypothetical protein
MRSKLDFDVTECDAKKLAMLGYNALVAFNNKVSELPVGFLQLVAKMDQEKDVSALTLTTHTQPTPTGWRHSTECPPIVSSVQNEADTDDSKTGSQGKQGSEGRSGGTSSAKRKPAADRGEGRVRKAQDVGQASRVSTGKRKVQG